MQGLQSSWSVYWNFCESKINGYKKFVVSGVLLNVYISNLIQLLVDNQGFTKILFEKIKPMNFFQIFELCS